LALSLSGIRVKREIVLTPKFYYFDAGVYRSIRPSGPLDLDSEADGPGIETLFLQNFKAVNEYFNLGYEIYYWRTRAKEEVDFILYGKKGLHAVEIKRKANLTSHDFKGLQLFQEDYPMAKLYMLYGGSQSYHERNIRVIPITEFLKNIKNYF